MSRAYLGLGTNMGDRLDYLNKACDLLEQNENVLSLKKSNLYETKAWGYTDQADFLNMCVEIHVWGMETSVQPEISKSAVDASPSKRENFQPSLIVCVTRWL